MGPYPHPIYLLPTLILFFHTCLRLPGDLFPSVVPTKVLYVFLISHMRATCLTYLILLDLVMQTVSHKLSSLTLHFDAGQHNAHTLRPLSAFN